MYRSRGRMIFQHDYILDFEIKSEWSGFLVIYTANYRVELWSPMIEDKRM